MKKNTKHSLFVVIMLLCISLCIYFLFPKPPCSIASFEKRAVWLSYQELSGMSYRSQKLFQKDFGNIVKTIKKYENNTIIVQVRAFSDALYQSKLFPFSKVITGHSSLSFDPLKEMVTIAHEEGISIEAWVNPYRISLNQTTYQQFLNSSHSHWLSDSHTIQYGNNQFIMNPANKEVRNYIVKGIEEIVSHYDVDGIHFDDYFYIQGTHQNTTQQERLDNVNMLISDVYHSIKSIHKDVTFGISPQGNYENCLNEGADVDTWLKEEGYVDYLMPQIYWSNEYGSDGKTSMFTNRAKLYSSLSRHKNMKLYVGLALYHAGEELDYDQGWSRSSHNISDQIQILSDLGYDGYSLFKYSSLKSQAGQKEMDELLRVHP